MIKKVVPKKVVIEISAEGTYKTGVIQYQIEVDGVLDAAKFYTMGIDTWMGNEVVDILLSVAKSKVEEGEKIPASENSKNFQLMESMAAVAKPKQENQRSL